MMIRRAIVYSIGAAALLAVPLQCIIDFSIVNIASSCIVLASGLVTLLYISGTDALDTQPLSTFSIVGLCITQQLGALLVQTAAWTPLKNSLYDPLYTFGMLAIFQLIAIAVHIAYRFFSKPKPSGIQFFRGLLTWAGVYRTPPCIALWLMGFVGLASHGVYVSNSLQMSVIGKFGMGFNFLAWAPFLIPYYHGRFGESFCSWKLNRVMLVLFALLMGVVGLAMNARGVMLTGITTIGLLYFLLGLRSNAPVTGRFLKWTGVCALLVFALGGPVSDLATSMAIARYMGPNVSASAKLDRALWVFHHPAVIAAFREQQSGFARLAYNEHYIENPILQRFVETKFDDNSFHFGRLAASEVSQERLREVSIKFLWGVLPTPLLDQMGVHVTKNELNYSMGDYLPYLTEGQPLGGHRVGSMFGQGMALFGVLFPLVFAGMCVVLFYLMDLLTVREEGDVGHVSALGILQIWNYFLSGLSYEALHLAFWFVARIFWQTMLIYVSLLSIGQLFSGKPAPVAPARTESSGQLPRAVGSVRTNPAAHA
jgi:hypothetical protein